jgi:hypothetical protein
VCAAFERDLLNHLVLENLLLVHDLDGHRATGLGVPRKPDLCERALAYGSAELVLPHTSLHLGRTHSLAYPPASGISGASPTRSSGFTVLCGKKLSRIVTVNAFGS